MKAPIEKFVENATERFREDYPSCHELVITNGIIRSVAAVVLRGLKDAAEQHYIEKTGFVTSECVTTLGLVNDFAASLGIDLGEGEGERK